MRASKLVGASGFVGKFASKNIPGDNRNYPNYYLPEDRLFVLDVKDWNPTLKDGRIEVRYLNIKNNLVDFVHVPKDFSIIKCGKKVAAPIMKKVTSILSTNPRVILSHSFTSGTDPEIFIANNKNELIPAFSFLGDKKNPNKYPTKYPTGNIYWDGFQAEFDTRAHGCLDGLATDIRQALYKLIELAKAHDKDAKLSIKPVFDIPAKMLANGKEEHVQFGCAPSMNIYGMQGLTLNGREVAFRPAGGHLHFGVGKLTEAETTRIVKTLDAVLGVACVSLFEKFDDVRRRTMYGLAGEYRLPPHGIEYRTLSNAWLYHPLMYHMVFDLARKCVVIGRLDIFDSLWKTKEEETVRVINEHDVDGARNIMKKNKDTMLMLFEAVYGTKETAQLAYKVFFTGMHNVIDNPEDIVNNWQLHKQVGYDQLVRMEMTGRRMANSTEVLKKKVG